MVKESPTGRISSSHCAEGAILVPADEKVPNGPINPTFDRAPNNGFSSGFQVGFMTVGQSVMEVSRLHARGLCSYQTAARARMEALSSYLRHKAMIPYPRKSMAEMSEAEWERAFPDEESCIEWLVMSRWPQEKHCPRCGSDLVFPASLHEYRWRCFGCAPDLGYSFDYLTGTAFQDGGFPLRLWLKTLHRELTGRRINYGAGEQAMRRRIRKALRELGFCRVVGACGPVPSRKKEPDEDGTLSDADQSSCTHRGPFAILLR